MIFYKYNGKILCSREDDYPYEKVDIHGADDTVKASLFFDKKTGWDFKKELGRCGAGRFCMSGEPERSKDNESGCP